MSEDYLTDDEQVEHIKRVVAENWVWVAGGVVVGAALIFGYRYYDGYRNQQALRAATQFDAMTAALSAHDDGRSRQSARDLIQQFPASPYADQAQLVLARLAVEDGKTADAIEPLNHVMTESKDAELRHVARLRLARLLISQGKPDEAMKTLAEDNWGAFAARAHEVRGDAFQAKHESKSAVQEYQAALAGGDPGSVDAGRINTTLLQLKIADLGEPAAPVTAASTPNKAAP